jgi:hypothetical protein
MKTLSLSPAPGRACPPARARAHRHEPQQARTPARTTSRTPSRPHARRHADLCGLILGLAAAGLAALGLAAPLRAETPAPDPKAMELAQATLAAMGGQEAWNRTHYIAWNFFGHRQLIWDKWTGDVRIELDSKDGEHYVVLLNVNTKKGRAWKAGTEVTAPDDLAKLMEHGYEIWINDSYWLVMPYKLRDPGVTLKYKGEMAMQDGRPSDCLELTFDHVGVTPENKYMVYIAKDSHLVEQWEYFEKASDEKPAMQTPWHDWKRCGSIMLSGDRGEHKLNDICVFDVLPRAVFESPGAVDLKSMTAGGDAGAKGGGSGSGSR